MTRRKGWLESFLEPEAERAQRRTVEQFAAYRWNGTDVVQEAVRDVSPSGVYILTKDRWQPGTLVTLTLQREGPLEMNSERRIDVQAKVARCGSGVGLAFVLPKNDPASRQWESLRTSLIAEAKARRHVDSGTAVGSYLDAESDLPSRSRRNWTVAAGKTEQS